jgi:hypothetical protein
MLVLLDLRHLDLEMLMEMVMVTEMGMEVITSG